MSAVWVLSGGLPAGARRMKMEAGGKGIAWIDMCLVGQHLPQMYQEKEIFDLIPEGCARLALCPDCLGYGTLATLSEMYPYGVDEIPDPCKTCGGSGRPALRVTVARDESTVTGHMEVVPHAFAEPFKGTMQCCLACGLQRDEGQHE